MLPARYVIAILVPSLTTSVAMASPPAASLWWAIDGETPSTTELEGTQGSNGNGSYSTSITAGGGTCTLTLLLNADFTADLQTNVNGQIKLINNGSSVRDIAFGFEVPICPAIDGPSSFGVLTVMTLNTNGPGSIVCVQDGLFNATDDGEILKSLYTCPYQLATSGSGTLTANAQFGTPGTSAAGNGPVERQGAFVRCLLSGLDQVTFTFTYNLADDDGIAPAPCQTDLNGDGVVGGQDLTLFLADWDMISECPDLLAGDVNLDGLVNGEDLSLLLSTWGRCIE